VKLELDADSAPSGTNFNTANTVLLIADGILAGMKSHASSTYPEECCGLLLGVFEGGSRTKRVIESKRMGNVFVKEERYHRYTIDPKEFLVTETDAESRGLEVVGIYHSHPDAPAKPSQFDTNLAWPTLSYVVMRVTNSRPEETRSWVLRDDRSEFTEEKISTFRGN
jgi:proteasome lid subunit RPN8/RPN11